MPDNSRKRAAILAVAVTLLTVTASAAPRPFTQSEIAAINFAIDYLRTERVDPHWLAHNCTLDAREDDLALLFGPRKGASWKLLTATDDEHAAFQITFPSGLDEFAIFKFAPENGGMKIADLRFGTHGAVESMARAKAGGLVATEPREAPLRQRGLIWLALVFAIAGVVLWRSTRAGAAMCAIGAIVVLGLALPGTSFRPQAQPPPRPASAPSPIQSLSQLRGLRHAVALEDENFREEEQRLGTVIHGPRDTRNLLANLWGAQLDLRRLNADATTARLSPFVRPSGVLAVELLRARLARLQMDYETSLAAYDRAIALLPAADGLPLEAAQAASALGVDTRAMQYLERAASLGSRDAEVYYTIAQQNFSRGAVEAAEQALLTAWRLERVPRRLLLRLAPAGLSASTASAIDLKALYDTEVRPTSNMKPSPLALDQMRVQTVADTLHVDPEQDAHLDVPGGAILTQYPDAVMVSAEQWAAEKDKRLLDEVENFRNAARQRINGTLRGPVPLRLTPLIAALEEHNRWDDLIDVTDGISPSTDGARVEVIISRCTALRRARRTNDASALLAGVAESPVVKLQRDPDVLAKLAELYADIRRYDVAIGLLERATHDFPAEHLTQRLLEVKMDQKMVTSAPTLVSRHFELHFPDESMRSSVTLVAQKFEDEYDRLHTWFPNTTFEPIVVYVVSNDEFRSAYSGTDTIPHRYRDPIRVPFAGVPSLTMDMRRTISHRLFHALLAQATNDQAPGWFQEGFAQFIEPKPYETGADPDLPDERLLPFELLDAGLTSADPGTRQAAYLQTAMVIRYIHDGHEGPKGLERLIEEFASGKRTAEALHGETLDLISWRRTQRWIHQR